MHSEYTTILKLIPRASKRVNDGHAVLRPDDASRDVLHTPRFVGSRRARRWLTRYFRPRRMHQGDRGYLHSEIAANPVQGSSRVTGSHEGEGGAWRFLIFSSDSRRPDIPRQDSLTRGSGRPVAPTQRMNVRPWFGSAVLTCSIHSFLGGGASSRSISGRRRPDYPGSVADAQMDGMTASGR